MANEERPHVWWRRGVVLLLLLFLREGTCFGVVSLTTAFVINDENFSKNFQSNLERHKIEFFCLLPKIQMVHRTDILLVFD